MSEVRLRHGQRTLPLWGSETVREGLPNRAVKYAQAIQANCKSPMFSEEHFSITVPNTVGDMSMQIVFIDNLRFSASGSRLGWYTPVIPAFKR